MTDVDLVLLAIIGISALLGLWRGLVRVLVSLAAWLLGGIAASLFGADVAQFFAGAAAPRAVHLVAGYGASFTVVFMLVVALGWVVRRLVQSIGLSGVDRLLGLAFGVVRGGLVACLLVVVMGFTSFPQRPGWRDSQLLPLLLPGAQWASARLPDWAALPVGPVHPGQNVDLNSIDLHGVDFGGAVLKSNVLNGAGSKAATVDGADLNGDGRSGGDLDGRDSTGADLDRRDSLGDNSHSSNHGDARALPQPGG